MKLKLKLKNNKYVKKANFSKEIKIILYIYILNDVLTICRYYTTSWF